jgi:hypothetical protein
MDEKIIKIVAARLRRFGGEPITQEKLAIIRDDVYKATKTNKFAPFSNVTKWVKAARGYMKKAEKHVAKPSKGKPAPSKRSEPVREAPIPEVSKKVEDSVNLIKEEAAPAVQLQEVNLPRPTIVFDKVYLQSIKFEIAGIRQTMERVSRQLDKLERELSEHGED